MIRLNIEKDRASSQSIRFDYTGSHFTWAATRSDNVRTGGAVLRSTVLAIDFRCGLAIRVISHTFHRSVKPSAPAARS